MPQQASNSARRRNEQVESIGRAYDLIEYYFRIAVVINAVPFTYNPRRRRFSVRKTSVKYMLWVLLMPIGMLLETAQVTWELVATKDDSTVSRGEWALIAFIFSSWTFILSVHYNVIRRHREMVNHINQTIALREWFTEERLPPTGDHKIVRAHIISSCMQCFFQCLMVAAEGTKAHFLYSNVPPEYRTPLTGSIWALYAYYRVSSNFLSGYFQLFAGSLHVQTCNQILALRVTGGEDLWQNLKYYRMIQILCSRYSETYSGCFIPQITKFATENLILGIYGTVKFYDHIAMEKYMNFPLMVVMMVIFVLTFYPKKATVYETSKGEKRQALKLGLKRVAGAIWKRPVQHRMNNSKKEGMDVQDTKEMWMMDICKTRGNTEAEEPSHALPGLGELKEMKCIARSCPTVGIPFGSLYQIKQSTVLNLFNFIACNTISTLLTYP